MDLTLMCVLCMCVYARVCGYLCVCVWSDSHLLSTYGNNSVPLRLKTIAPSVWLCCNCSCSGRWLSFTGSQTHCSLSIKFRAELKSLAYCKNSPQLVFRHEENSEPGQVRPQILIWHPISFSVPRFPLRSRQQPMTLTELQHCLRDKVRTLFLE